MLVDYQKVNICQGGELILKDVEFSVDTDQFIYIIGKVGSGKSSLLKTMYCELDIPNQETQKAERRDIPALRKEMGIIFQDFQLLHDRSVFKNLQFILHSTGWKSNKDINNRIEQVLSDVGMSDKKDKYPHELSGGEQQRIAIARAVLNTPKIIIADEPTGNLDPETANNIVELLRKITESGTSVIMSTHNISMLKKYPGIIYKCEDGSLTNITNEYYNAQKV